LFGRIALAISLRLSSAAHRPFLDVQDNSNKFMPAFRTLQKSVTEHNNNLARMYVAMEISHPL
jgi:hypothetical protein